MDKILDVFELLQLPEKFHFRKNKMQVIKYLKLKGKKKRKMLEKFFKDISAKKVF